MQNFGGQTKCIMEDLQLANGALQVLCSNLQKKIIFTITEFLKTLKHRVCILQPQYP